MAAESQQKQIEVDNTRLRAEVYFPRENLASAENTSNQRALENKEGMDSLRRDLREAQRTSGMYRRQKETSDLEVENLKAKLRSHLDAEEDFSRVLRRSAERVAEFENRVALASSSDPGQGNQREIPESKHPRVVTKTKAATAVQGTNSFWMSQV